MTIKQKQLQLKHLGYYTGKIDGSFGNQSKEATRKFQRAYGLEVDGSFGALTEAKSILVWKNYQQQLTNKGYAIAVDGYCGTNTINAIKNFQRDNGLVVDGIIGVNTTKALNSSNVYMTEKDWSNSKYFKASEFKCPCGCGAGKVKKSLVDNLNVMRQHFGKPITITSGLRCPSFNKRAGGVSNSKHLTTIGGAVDLYIAGLSDTLEGRKQLVNYWINTFGNANYSYCNGYGKTKSSTSYPKSSTMGNAVHVDVK